MNCCIPAVVSLLIASSSASAVPMDSGHPLSLVQSASVQKELAMTPDQVKAVAPLLAAALDDAKIKEANAAVAKTLDAAQVKRLQEISLQMRGGLALADEVVGKELTLTGPQTKTMNAIAEDREKDLRMVLQVTRFRSPLAKRNFMLVWRKDVADKMLGELTAEQKAAFEKMQGKKFDTSSVVK